jgi:hypothetical protein
MSKLKEIQRMSKDTLKSPKHTVILAKPGIPKTPTPPLKQEAPLTADSLNELSVGVDKPNRYYQLPKVLSFIYDLSRQSKDTIIEFYTTQKKEEIEVMRQLKPPLVEHLMRHFNITKDPNKFAIYITDSGSLVTKEGKISIFPEGFVATIILKKGTVDNMRKAEEITLETAMDKSELKHQIINVLSSRHIRGIPKNWIFN